MKVWKSGSDGKPHPLWKEIGNAAERSMWSRVIARQPCEKLSTPTWVFLSLSLSILHPLHISSLILSPSASDGSYLRIRYSIGFIFHLFAMVRQINIRQFILIKFLRTLPHCRIKDRIILIIRIISIFQSILLPSNFNESSKKKKRNQNQFYLINRHN